jgi:hypothetical protein
MSNKKWHPVEDGLPKQVGRYLIQTSNGIDIDSFHPRSGWHSYGETQYGDTSKSIIAWRKLPEPYRK